jgi:hypothetical protein
MSFTVSFAQDWLIRSYPTQSRLTTPSTAEPSRFIDVNIYPIWFKQVNLDWTIPADWGNCTFHVYSSQGDEAAFQRLTTQALTNPRFTNTQSRETSVNRSEDYIVEAILPNGQQFRSYSINLVNKRRTKIEIMASEIQRREYMLLTKFTGVKSYLFKAKYFGNRCPRCWSASQEKVMDDKCNVCYGTSWDGGYWDPVPVFLQYEPNPQDRTPTYFGELEANQIGAWTISVPEISPTDIIIRSGDWNVYSVIRNNSTELQTAPVRQMLTLTQLSRNDIENALLSRQVTDDFGTYLESLGGNFSLTRFPRNQVNASPSDDPIWTVPEDTQTRDLPLKYRI